MKRPFLIVFCMAMCTLALSQIPNLPPENRQKQEDGGARIIELFDVDGDTKLMVRAPLKELASAKISPKGPYAFQYLTTGYARTGQEAGRLYLRFRVYSQTMPEKGGVEEQVTRALLRCWEQNYYRLGLDHSDAYFNQTVDVYLCKEGKAGGEQMMTEDRINGKVYPVNNIYIYDVPSFTKPIEMLREVAHEYGHATLPPIGGFGEPEDWANGDLGERLYLQWFREALLRGFHDTQDTLGASLPALHEYVQKNIEPLVKDVLTKGPDFDALKAKGQKAFDAYLALACYAEGILPPAAFSRSLVLPVAQSAVAFEKALHDAVAELAALTIASASMMDKTMWVPIGKGTLKGGAIKQRRGKWAEVKVTDKKLTITNPPPPKD